MRKITLDIFVLVVVAGLAFEAWNVRALQSQVVGKTPRGCHAECAQAVLDIVCERFGEPKGCMSYKDSEFYAEVVRRYEAGEPLVQEGD